jgi:hypothetical protein
MQLTSTTKPVETGLVVIGDAGSLQLAPAATVGLGVATGKAFMRKRYNAAR